MPNRVATLVDVARQRARARSSARSLFAEPLLLARHASRWASCASALVIPGAWGDAGLVLLMLWLLAQLNPALPFFGAGNIARRGAPWRPLLMRCSGPRWRMSICGFGLFVSALLKPEPGDACA